MPELPGLFAKLRLQTKEWTAGLRKAKGDLQGAEQATKATGGRMGRIFGGIGKSIKGAVGQIPGIGGALTQMLTPVGLATVAVASLGAALVKSVTKVSGLERELRPMQQRSGLAAESLQVLSKAAERLGSEDGLEGVTDGAQELQLRLAEAVQDGTGPAVEAFAKLGLASEDLINKSPEESFLSVIEALQNVNNEADRKFLADELMGGASEKLSGIVNENSVAFKALTADIRENGDIVSNEGVANARAFNDGLDRLKNGAGRLLNTLGTALMPVLLRGMQAFEKFAAEIKSGLLPGLRDIWDVVGPILTPVLKALFNIVLAGTTGPLRSLSNSVQALGRLFKGDFAGALNFAKQAFLGAMSGIVAIYNETVARIPYVAKIDMEGIADAIGIVKTAAGDLEPPMVDVATATRDTATAARDASLDAERLGNTLEVTGEKAETAADRIGALKDRIAEWQEAQENAGVAQDALYAGMAEGALTVDELEQQLAELEEATEEAGETTGRISRGQTADFNLWVDAHREGIGDIIEGEEAKATAAEEAATRVADAAKDAADTAERETDRMISSWDRFKVNQDATVMAMNENNIRFDDVMAGLATSFGISTTEMADKAIGLGVEYNDTMALMEAFGREKINAIIAQINLAKKAAEDAAAAIAAVGSGMSLDEQIAGIQGRGGRFMESMSDFRKRQADRIRSGDISASELERFSPDTLAGIQGVAPDLNLLSRGGIVRNPPGSVRTPPVESGQMIDNRFTLELDGAKWDDVHVTSHSRNRRTGRE